MCNCIATLVEKGFIERECVYEDSDFKDKGFRIRKYEKGGKHIIETDRVFHMNYCPACGEKLASIS